MKKEEVVYLKLDELKPYVNNPRNNDGAIEYVKNSIEQFGFRNPILVDKNYEIIAGHTRYRASQELGLEEVPCLVIDDLSEEQIKALRIVDNKTADMAEWDDELLGIELESIMGSFDMTDFGFGDFELSILTDDQEPEDYDKELIEQFSQGSEDFLENKRIIITYKTDEEEAFLKRILNTPEEEEMKVVTPVKEIMDRFGE